MKTKTIQLRMRWKTWIALRLNFPGRYDESAADYFERLSEHLKEQEK